MTRTRRTKSSPRWRALAAALAERLTTARLNRAAVSEIRAELENSRAPLAIACSGGADSVALALALWAHIPVIRGRMLIVHFNHRLRGRAADEDARFVRALARGLGERCVVGAWRRARGASGKVSEAEAREARLDFFRETMREAKSRVIALGHQRDDVAETMLMRLARGSGAGGLASPRPVQRIADGTRRVRPMLDVSAGELRDALRAIGATWREDATNAGDVFFRNRVRRHVLPALAAASPQEPLAGFAASRAQLEEDDDALAVWLAEVAPQPSRGNSYDVRALARKPRALARRAVQAWLANEGLGESLSRPAVAQIADAVCGKSPARDLRTSAGAESFVVFSGGRLSLEKEVAARGGWPEATLRPGAAISGPQGDRLTARMRRLTSALRARILGGEFPASRMVFLDPGANWMGFFSVRSWRAGDRYRPLGAPGRAKLQDIFVNRKVPREQRALLPVVCITPGIPCWVPGLPPDNTVAVQPGSKHVVQLTYHPAGTIVRR